MVKVICQHSGIEFEASSARAKQHPLVADLKTDANRRGTYAAAMKAMEVVRKDGGYATIEEFVSLVNAEVAGTRKAQIASKIAAENDRRDAQQKLKEQNALLKANGYRWSKEETTGYFGGDSDAPEYAWTLIAPDGRAVTVQQAIAEIQNAK